MAIGLFNDELHLLLMSSDCTVNVSGLKSIELTENSEEHGMIQLQSCSIEALKENSLLAMRCMISYQSDLELGIGTSFSISPLEDCTLSVTTGV